MASTKPSLRPRLGRACKRPCIATGGAAGLVNARAAGRASSVHRVQPRGRNRGHFRDRAVPAPLKPVSGLDGLAPANGVSHQDALAGLLKRQKRRVELVRQVVDGGAVADPRIIADGRRSAKQAFQVWPAVPELRRSVRHQLCLGGIEDGDALALYFRAKSRLFVPDDFRYADNLDRLTAGAG